MQPVTMLKSRKIAEGILRPVWQREGFVPWRRGDSAARLEPIAAPRVSDPASDFFLTIGGRAFPDPRGKTRHTDIDSFVCDSD